MLQQAVEALRLVHTSGVAGKKENEHTTNWEARLQWLSQPRPQQELQHCERRVRDNSKSQENEQRAALYEDDT